MTGADLLPLLDDVTTGRADMSVGARRPSARGVWPWHARLGNRAVLALLKRRTRDFSYRYRCDASLFQASVCSTSKCKIVGSGIPWNY